MKRTYRVTACGVSLICEEGPEMLGWITYIIARAGIPEIQVWAEKEAVR